MWLWKTPPQLKAKYSALPANRANYLACVLLEPAIGLTIVDVRQYMSHHGLDSYIRYHTEVHSIRYFLISFVS